MRYIDRKEPGPSAVRKLGYAVVGLSCVLAGSAALAWQNGGSGKLRSTQIEEAALPMPSDAENDKTLNQTPEKAPSAAPALPPIINAPNASVPRAQTTAPATAPKSSSTTRSPAGKRRSIIASDNDTQPRSILPFSIPGITDNDKGEKKASTSKNTAPQRFNPAASSKALGRSGSTTRSARTETTDEPQETAPPVRMQPKPAAPAAAPVVRSAPKPAAIVKPAPVVTAAPKPAAPRANRPQVAAVSKKLAPLEFKPHSDIRAAGFQEITPGQSKLSSIAQQLGEPANTQRQGDTTTMTYEVGPFPKVEIILAGDVVDSVVIHLNEPAAEADVLSELSLAQYAAVPVYDDEGQILGKAIPERGVAISYEGDPSEAKVAQVVLATISAEPFLMRATSSDGNRYANILADATYAQSLDKKSAEAHAITARVLSKLGRVSEAKTAIEAAILIDAGAADYRLLYAHLLGQSGDFTNAAKMIETIATTPSVAPEFVAQAECEWGQLLADGPSHDYAGAIEHLSRAIKLATPLSQSEDVLISRTGLRTLIDANLAIAGAVASGNYKRKPEVVPKWLAKAEAAAQTTLEAGADPYLQLYVPAKTLAIYAKMEEPLDPTDAVEAALQAGQDLIAEATDPLYKRQLEWELGVALLDAIQIEHARGQFDRGTQYANNALALLSENAEYREATAQRDYTLGKLFFSTGALFAIGQEDHAEAVHYYLQAIPLLSQPLAPELQADLGNHGERFVSMGVSFWQNGNKQQAVELTLAGVQYLRDAITSELVENDALGVPYGNLAAMYRQLGNSSEAGKYAELAKRLEARPATTKR